MIFNMRMGIVGNKVSISAIATLSLTARVLQENTKSKGVLSNT